MASKSLDSITPSDIESLGITRQDSASLHQLLKEIVAIHCVGTPATWQNITKRLLTPLLPFSFHQMLYYGCYKNYGHDPPAWVPDPANAVLTNVGQLLDRRAKEFLVQHIRILLQAFLISRIFQSQTLRFTGELYWMR